MRYYRNTNGFSLMSVIVALGLSGVLLLVVLNLTQQSNQVIKNATLSVDAIDYELILEDLFRSEKACTATFGHLPSGKFPGYELRKDGGYQPNDSLNLLDDGLGIMNADLQELWSRDQIVTGGYKISEMKLATKRLVSGEANLKVIDALNNEGILEVIVKLQKPGVKNLGGEFKIISFNITAKLKNITGGDTRIMSCQLTGTPGAVAPWVDVPLTDTNDFDPNCTYRIRYNSSHLTTNNSLWNIGLDSNYWSYPETITQSTLIWGTVLINDKQFYQLTRKGKKGMHSMRTCNNGHPKCGSSCISADCDQSIVEKIEKRCN